MMRKSLILFTSVMLSGLGHGQVGINTNRPKATLDVQGKPALTTQADGIIAPVLTGNQLKAKDSSYGSNQVGTFVYVTTAADPVSTKTQNVSKAGYYYFDGLIWSSFIPRNSGEATRYLGGTVYTKFNATNNGTLPSNNVIGGGNISYNIGPVSAISTAGGINSILGGSTYTISNPANGIFDVRFIEPLTEIIGISINIVDAYGGGTNGTPNGTNPNTIRPGQRLDTTDNTQVSFLSNSIIRIKTGDSRGTLANRSFTFLVTGR